MRNLILIIIVLKLGPALFSQSLAEDWNRVVIQDEIEYYRPVDRSYQINRAEGKLIEIGPDTVIKSVNTDLISQIIELSQKDAPATADPLAVYGYDTTWFKENVDSLWFEMKKNLDADLLSILEEEDDEVTLSILNDYSVYREDMNKIQGWGSYIGKTLVLTIMSPTDTLVIKNQGHFVYLLPWKIEETEVHSMALSKMIGQLLPENQYYSNSRYLKDEFFMQDLLFGIYDSHIRGETAYRKARRRFPIKFKRLEKRFDIVGGDYHMIGSIEWANDFLIALQCVELTLHEERLPKNVDYAALFGCRLYFMHPIGPFLRKRRRIVDRLSKNPVYQYIISNENCSASIHFVNRRSLSPVAKRFFKENLRENNIDPKKYRGQLRKAIFFDNYEYVDGERSFTRWLVLKDGTTILWQNEGSHLLNVKPEYIPEEGYNCVEIKPSQLIDRQ